MDTTTFTLLSLFGLIMGSAMSSVIYRIRHQELSFVTGFSICPKCNNQLEARDLVPLLSYAIQGGRCRHCGKAIPWHYPVLEVSVAFLFLAIGLAGFEPLVFHLIFAWVLVFIFFYDLLYMEVPDEVMLPGLSAAVLFTLSPETISIYDGVAGAAAISGFFLLQIVISRGKWIGGGDLRIGAFMGMILGLKFGLVALFLSYLIGSIISVILLSTGKVTRKSMVPFGPFLVFGTLITMFYGPEIVEGYLEFIAR